MHLRTLIVAIAALFLAATSVEAETHSHQGHEPPGLDKLGLDGGSRWKTDAPLRKGMDGIRHDLERSLGAIHRGTLDQAGYAALAHRLQGHVDYMVANCKLPPAVDAQAHIVLEQIIAGIAMMEQSHGQADGAVRIVAALDAYGRVFDHPHWTAPKH